MIIKSGVIKTEGKVIDLNKKIICNIKDSEYYKLEGYITEARTGADKESENEEEVEFEVRFEIPTNKSLIARVEEDFSKLYGEPKEISDIILDMIIMTADEIKNI